MATQNLMKQVKMMQIESQIKMETKNRQFRIRKQQCSLIVNSEYYLLNNLYIN